MKKKIFITLACIFSIGGIYFYTIMKISYFVYESYYKNTASSGQYDSISLQINISGQSKYENKYLSVFDFPYTAVITVMSECENKKSIIIEEIAFIDLDNRLMYAITDCKTVYDSKKQKIVEFKNNILKGDMYYNFCYENLILPKKLFVRVDFKDQKDNSTFYKIIELKRAKRFFLNTI